MFSVEPFSLAKAYLIRILRSNIQSMMATMNTTEIIKPTILPKLKGIILLQIWIEPPCESFTLNFSKPSLQ